MHQSLCRLLSWLQVLLCNLHEKIRKVFEPKAPPIGARINAIKTLHDNGIKTYAFIGPVLPMNPDALIEKLRPHVDSVIIDRMNYTSKTLQICRNMNLTKWLDRGFTDKVIGRLKDGFDNKKGAL